MIYDGLSEEETVITLPKEVISLDNKNSILKGDLMRILLSDLHELNSEVIKLQREVSKCNQRVAQLENRKKPYGKEVYTRVYSMLTLINDYGGSMTSTTVKRLMGLSKDEFYRTLRCAKDENQIELTPNAKDQRSYIIKTKA
jgi:SMC interacting uncharacterized protein involved in chromosome segregation